MPELTFTLPPQYDPHAVEAPLYRRWQERGLFAPRADAEPYVVVIPPPNVTGVLHMGHGLNNTIQDVLIRFERMRGRAAEWLPGTDHAGIATQNVVERLIAKEGKTRFDLGREGFVARVWEFIRGTGPIILEQLRQIGCSCDWDRTRFTFDEHYTHAVREVFVALWEEGLIYRGHRVIHWCPRCLTALSDEEAESRETTGNLYHIKYPLADGSGSVTVATTRPETLLGDTAVVVHPDDPRGRPYLGKQVRLPIVNIPIPVLADESVDKDFGTGFVKVTPAHDPNDFEIGMRHKLEMPLIMTEDGHMGEGDGKTEGRKGESQRVPVELAGLDRFEARKKIVKMLEAQGLLVKVEPHHHAIRRCYRCDTVVEPRLSDQWFVKMKPLAEPVLAAYRRGEFAIVPERWRATFENWMENIRDWNISRQLWWGHRIPVFTCTKCKHRWADRADPQACPNCGGPLEQDPDVLDTWFSSWLWPFATFGWPERTADLARFYPGHTLVTAPEILFFWVARMLMAGYHFMGKKPFSTVYLTGTARDTQHRRMSKSLGNGIDPLDVVKLYGADALRWTLVGSGSLGADVILDPNDLETTFAPGRNFANKLWNIGRFILSQLPTQVTPIERVGRTQLTLADRWILSRAQATIREATASLEQFRLDEAAKTCFAFVWGELADWYVEAVKPRLSAGTEPTGSPSAAAQRAPAAAGDPVASRAAAQAVLSYCLDVALRLLHPVVPFITEELWQKLPGRGADELLPVASWPTTLKDLVNEVAERQFAFFQEGITKTRNVRSDYQIPPRQELIVHFLDATKDSAAGIASEKDTFERIGHLKLRFDPIGSHKGAATILRDGSEIFVVVDGVIDFDKQRNRLRSELSRLDHQIQKLAERLADPKFLSQAPAEIVDREREKERSWRRQHSTVFDRLHSIGG
jgi:valyl-tRNA synthetase